MKMGSIFICLPWSRFRRIYIPFRRGAVFLWLRWQLVVDSFTLDDSFPARQKDHICLLDTERNSSLLEGNITTAREFCRLECLNLRILCFGEKRAVLESQPLPRRKFRLALYKNISNCETRLGQPLHSMCKLCSHLGLVSRSGIWQLKHELRYKTKLLGSISECSGWQVFATELTHRA